MVLLRSSCMLLLVFLFGCNSVPVYKTQYILEPPFDREGRSCVLSCDDSRQQCMGGTSAQQQKICNTEHQQKKNQWLQCLDTLADPAECGAEPVAPVCDLSAEEICESAYRSCYQQCGGVVKQRNVCVEGC